MKSNFIRIALLLLFFTAFLGSLAAQTGYPIQIQTSFAPPYPFLLDEFKEYLEKGNVRLTMSILP
jgi:hypothetical protein